MHIPAPIFNKTRIAPTPSGFLHLGNVLSFTITAALASKTGAKILLRIDDLDQQRVNPIYIQDIFDTLNFMEISWDEGPRDADEYKTSWSQLHRMDRYRDALQKLKHQGNVFACQCSRTQIRTVNTNIYPGTCRHKGISLDTPNVNWRLHTDAEKKVVIRTLKDGVVQAPVPADMNNFIVMKKDGNPSYQLASLLDDVYYGVDLVIRGNDLWPSTIAQHYLGSELNQDAFKNAAFHHHPLLMEPDGQKLSKSAGATAIHHLRGQGKTAANIYAEIGTMLDIQEPITSREELIKVLAI